MEGFRERGLGHHVGDLTGSPGLTSSLLSERTLRRLRLAAPVLVVVALAVWVMRPAPDPIVTEPAPVPAMSPVPAMPGAAEAAAEPDASAGPEGIPQTGHPAPRTPPGWTGYAVALEELKGLPPDAQPGTRMDLWVMWEPPVTKQAKASLLVEDIALEKIVPAITPDGPDAAVLLLPEKKVRHLLYGDRFGALSVTLHRS